jgi:hypothetical protein
MLADAAAYTFLLIDDGPQGPVQCDSLIKDRTALIAAPAYGILPGETVLFLYLSDAHSDFSPAPDAAIEGA